MEFKNPLPDEIGLKSILLEDVDGDKVLGEAMVDLVIRPTYNFCIEDIQLCESTGQNDYK